MACGCRRRAVAGARRRPCGCKKRRREEAVLAEQFIPIGRITLDCAPVLFKTKGQVTNILCCPTKTKFGPVCCPPAVIPIC